ncbi:MAG: hypothetical protein CSA36_03220 [Draconibacterium sp.]|nr:MAG: hypothetical protein CSA36_03220 [Draconibacterium sp.]
MRGKKKNRFDHSGIGYIIGFLLPVLLFFLAYLFGNNDVSLVQYARGLWRLQALVKLISLCVFANSIAFMVFIRMKYEKTARGILGATIIYALVVLLSKIF